MCCRHVSVCPSVRLSHACIVSKRLNVESRKQRHTIAQYGRVLWTYFVYKVQCMEILFGCQLYLRQRAYANMYCVLRRDQQSFDKQIQTVVTRHGQVCWLALA